jgi:hypothetical protein
VPGQGRDDPRSGNFTLIAVKENRLRLWQQKHHAHCRRGDIERRLTECGLMVDADPRRKVLGGGKSRGLSQREGERRDPVGAPELRPCGQTLSRRCGATA